MKKYTVLIPTTISLVGITDIVEEDPQVSSVVCENNTLEALPISDHYNSFVKSPTGIIDKLTGHSSYRIDLTKPIQEGKSWQLAITIAHIFHNNNILNFSNENNLLNKNDDEVIWATGTINSNLEIKKVNYIDKKIQNSINFFRNCIKNKILITLVISKDNQDDFHDILDKNQFLKQSVKNKLIRVTLIKNLYDLFNTLNLKTLIKKHPNRLPILKKSKRIFNFFSIIFLAMIFFFIINNIWNKTSPLINLNDKKNYSMLLTTLKTYRYGNLTERVVAYFYDYVQKVHSDEINEQIKLYFSSYSEKEENKIKCVQNKKFIEHLCNLNLEITNIGEDPVFLWVLKISNFNPKKKIGQNMNKKSDIINGMIKSNEAFLIDIQNSQDPITLFLVYSKVLDIKIIDWLKKVDKENSLLETTIKRMKSLGYGYTINNIKNIKVIEEVI